MSTDFYNSQILPYAGIIIKICRAYTDSQEDFDDYYQEVCLQIWRSHKNFRNESNWSTWVYRLSLNVCLTLFNKAKKAPKHLAETAIDNLITHDTNAFDDEDLNHLYDAIKKLGEVDRAVILLHLEEKSYAEIAEIMGTNTNNVGVRIKRIKERLKKLLDGKVN